MGTASLHYLVAAYQDHLMGLLISTRDLLSKVAGILSRMDHAFSGKAPGPVCGEDMRVRHR